MKKGTLIGIILALLTGETWSQYGYQYVSGGYWFGVQFIEQEGWMVGAGGNILHTSDRGRNWAYQRSIERSDISNPNLFSDVAFKTRMLGWACVSPASKYVWRTTDGGRFWKTETLPARWGAYTAKLSFADSLHGWLVGRSPWGDYGNILATGDGGRTWSIQDQSWGLCGVFAGTPRHGWAVGNGGWMARTRDGGANWIKQQVSPNQTLFGVFFPDTLFGWACGDTGTIVHTQDGGLTWVQQTCGTTAGLMAIAFLGRNWGFAVGDSGTLLRTSDGGATWAPINTGVSADLATITFGDSIHGWGIGEGGTTLETSDGGLSWRVTRQGTTERIQGVSFVDDQTGWASSWEGNIWATLDGGKIWSKQASISPKRLQGLTMANANTGWAVGDSGLVLATQNGGATWAPQASGTQERLRCVFAGDAQHGWACGNGMEIVGTSNGGQTWNEQYAWPETTLYDITFCDSLHGWALFQDGHLLRTRTKGQTWAYAGDVGKGNWYHLNFVDSLWGWAAGDSGISRSTDGGRSWTRQNTSITERLWDVSGVSRMRAWAVGENGRILVTSDGGNTWTLQTSPVTTAWRGVDFADSLRGVACGDWYIINTSNGGNSWVPRLNATVLFAITMDDSLEGWSVGEGERIWLTTDGGNTWLQVHSGQYTLHAITFINRDEGWAGGGYPLSSWAVMLHTTDRGNSWTRTNFWGPIYSLWFADSLRGWFGSGDYYPGRMVTTTDGGQTWRAVGNPRMFATTGIASTSQIGAICGNNGLLLRTTDGSAWERFMGPTTSNLWGIGFGDQQTGWAVGWKGLRMATTDQGMNWQIQRQDALPDSLLMSVQAFDGLTARATGYLGRSVLTTDGGTTWQGEETGTKEWLLASSFLTPTLGWVAGENGMVLKYGRLPYGVEEEREQTGMPLFTWLGQNRPNPFTGGTDIKYQLANRGKVKLGVYNVLGQAVRELMSGEQEAGTYAIRWDGKDGAGKTTSSGVYFYRLEAFGKSQTRKMVKVR